jgi:hypothetical protein
MHALEVRGLFIPKSPRKIKIPKAVPPGGYSWNIFEKRIILVQLLLKRRPEMYLRYGLVNVFVPDVETPNIDIMDDLKFSSYLRTEAAE